MINGLDIVESGLPRATESRPAPLVPSSPPAPTRPGPAKEWLSSIEGLRAYLSLWVVVCHALWAVGYYPSDLTGIAKLLREGRYAVAVFVIVSGFVIFLLLDKKREGYCPFVIRRFFRLYPLFIAMFILAVPVSRLMLWDHVHASSFFAPEHTAEMTGRIHSWWDNFHWHALLHLNMMHGLVPQSVLPNAPGAFLEPAWSISLEWQFYLLAPLAFALATSAKPFLRIFLCAAAILLFLSRKVIPPVQFGAALPFHAEFFFLGGVSYFLYRQCAGKTPGDVPFPIACCCALFLYLTGPRTLDLAPFCLWLLFLGLLLEQRSSVSARLLYPLFNSPLVQYLGRLSYSIYLSHFLVLALVQYALLRLMPDLTRFAHFWMLLTLTIGVTIAVSGICYAYIEAPGMRLGRFLADGFRLRLIARKGSKPLPAASK